MDETIIAAFIKDVGVPIGAFIMMYVLYVHNQTWQQKQQGITEVRLDKLMNLFISSIKEITNDYNKALYKHTAALDKNTTKLEEQSAKLEEHVRLKDEFMEHIRGMKQGHG